MTIYTSVDYRSKKSSGDSIRVSVGLILAEWLLTSLVSHLQNGVRFFRNERAGQSVEGAGFFFLKVFCRI